ncbi:MAG TPA: hypothetical protein VMY37_18850 [Thermoguttaceae bacterium]|nr:hypothetical protein [Thermoguttaceae bacterium]
MSEAKCPRELISFDPAGVERRVLSEDNLRRALNQIEEQEQKSRLTQNDLAPGPGRTVEQVRQNLRVAATEASPERFGITISYSDRDPDRAVRLVNTLAKVCAEQYREDLETSGAGDYPEAREAAELARQEYFDAKGRLDDFIGQHFLKQQALADRVASCRPDLPSADALPADRAAGLTANRGIEARTLPPPPDRETVDLHRQLAELEQRRARLLDTRTPLHPLVRDVDTRIAGVRDRLASISARLAEQPPEVSPTEEGPTLGTPVAEDLLGTTESTQHVPADELAAELAEAAQAFRSHKDAMDRAEEEYDRLAEAKRRAWEAQISTPSIELEPAQMGEARQPADEPSGSMLVALASALAVTFGVGLIWSGFDSDLPLATLAEAEAALPVPVVGTIPATGPASTAPKKRSRVGGGLAKIIYGVLLIGVCFGILVAVF